MPCFPVIRCFLGSAFPVVMLMALVGCGDDDGGGDASVLDGAMTDTALQDGMTVDGTAEDAEVATDAFLLDANTDANPADAGPALRPIGPRPVMATSLTEGTLFASPDGSGEACTEANP